MRNRSLLSWTPILIALLLAGGLACGPIGPIRGGKLRGTPEPIPSDWSEIASVHTVQLETRPDDPHSVNIWIGVVDDTPYIATSLIRGTDVPAERDWVKNVLADPRVRLRVEGRIYELRAVRVEEPAQVERVREAMIEKYDVEADAHSSAAWVFRLESR
jgi:hypothetical protein